MKSSKKHLPFCPVSRSALIIGSKWTAQILNELLISGRSRFNALEDALSGITPAVLSNRLKMLEDAEIVGREIIQAHPPHAEYFLTTKGMEMKGIIGAMRDWGQRFPEK